MTTRRVLARIAALVTAAAAIGTCLGPASAEAADHRLDGSANRDPHRGTDGLGSAMAQAIGSRLDGGANRDLDIGAPGLASDMTQAIGLGSELDGWANRDLDIGAPGLDALALRPAVSEHETPSREW